MSRPTYLVAIDESGNLSKLGNKSSSQSFLVSSVQIEMKDKHLFVEAINNFKTIHGIQQNFSGFKWSMLKTKNLHEQFLLSIDHIPFAIKATAVHKLASISAIPDEYTGNKSANREFYRFVFANHLKKIVSEIGHENLDLYTDAYGYPETRKELSDALTEICKNKSISLCFSNANFTPAICFADIIGGRLRDLFEGANGDLSKYPTATDEWLGPLAGHEFSFDTHTFTGKKINLNLDSDD